MMNTYSLYDRNTGLFLSQVVRCAPSQLLANVPDGCSCLVGEYDRLAHRVDVGTGQVMDYIPPQPSDRHEWDVGIKRWVYVPTDLELCHQNRVTAYPPLSELADAIYWKARGDESKLQTYFARCDEVKTRYPKPDQGESAGTTTVTGADVSNSESEDPPPQDMTHIAVNAQEK